MPSEIQQPEWQVRVFDAMLHEDTSPLRGVLEDVHAADLAEFFSELEEEQQKAILDAISDEKAAELFGELDPQERPQAVELLPVERTSDIVEEMYSDDAADLLSELPAGEAEAILEHMEPDAADDVADLLRYCEDTAGGLMAKEYVQVHAEQTVEEVMSLLRRHNGDAEMIYYLYVVDEDDLLIGEVTLRQLIVSDPGAEMADIMRREFISVTPEMPSDEVTDLFTRHDLLAMPVVDAEGRMQGIITVDDIGEAVQEEAADELLEMSGSEDHEEQKTFWSSLRGWRSGLLALIGGAIGALIIHQFSGAFDDWVRVASLLPLLLVLGITAGSQAAIAMDRAYDSAVERHQLGRIFRREALASAVSSLLAGLLAGAALGALKRSFALGLAVGIPLALGLWLVSLVGALGVVALRQRGDHIGPTAHTFVMLLALLIGLIGYLLTASWYS